MAAIASDFTFCGVSASQEVKFFLGGGFNFKVVKVFKDFKVIIWFKVRGVVIFFADYFGQKFAVTQ